MENFGPKCLVYQHRRLDNNQIFYIGIAKNKKRPYVKQRRNKHWQNIVAKSGYEVEIVLENITWEKACELEVRLISYYGRKDLGNGNLVNMTNGGDGAVGAKHTEEYKQMLRERMKGNTYTLGYKHNEKFSETLSNRMKGNQHTLGRKSTEREKKLVSDFHKGRKRPEDTGKKISEATSTIILNTETGIFYMGYVEAAESVGKKKSWLNYRLNGVYENKTSLIKV